MSITDSPGIPAATRSAAFLVSAIALAVVYVLLPANAELELIRVVSPAVALGVVLLTTVDRHGERRLPWLSLACAFALLVGAHLTWSLKYHGGEPTFPSLVDALHIAAAVFVLVAVVSFERRDAPAAGTIGALDAAIGSVAVTVVVWLIVVEPALADPDLSIAETLWATVAPALGALAFAVALRTASYGAFRTFGPIVLTAAVGIQTVADMLRGVLELGGDFGPGSLVGGLGVAAPLIAAAGVSDRSMSFEAKEDREDPAPGFGRTVGLSVAVLTPLVVLLALLVADVATAATRIVVAVGALTVVGLALSRMWGVTETVRDLTERRGQDRLAAMVEHSSDVVFLVDETGDIKYASPGLVGSLGHRASDWIGRPLVDLIADEDRLAAQQKLDETIVSGSQTTVKFESNLVRVDGQRRRMEATIVNLIGGDAVDGIVATFRDVTEQRDLERQLSHRAFHDELTGLANRALFLDRMDHALRVARPDHDPVVVLFVDLDDFKSVNDALGHGVGDQLLRVIAERIRSVSGSGDTPARLGGDEFALLLEDRGGVDRALDVAERLLETLRQPVQLAGYDLAVLASVGVAVAAPGMTTSSLLRDADIAMYEAKRAGKGQIKIFDPAMRLGATSQLEYRSELGSALEHGELRLVYQPLVSLRTGEVVGAEALVRWRHPTRGDVSPAEFIPIAEKAGMIPQIGRWVMGEAMREASRWQVRGNRYVSINVSAVQLRTDGFVDDVRHALTLNRLDPSNVLIEVTETVLVEEIETASNVLEELSALGLRIAIDDFGTGYCSLSYLQKFPVDILKIDRKFVDEVDGDAKRSSLARMILEMTSAMEITSVAEGIERPGQLAALRQFGCDVGQGYLLSRPLEVDVLHQRFGIVASGPAYAAADG